MPPGEARASSAGPAGPAGPAGAAGGRADVTGPAAATTGGAGAVGPARATGMTGGTAGPGAGARAAARTFASQSAAGHQRLTSKRLRTWGRRWEDSYSRQDVLGVIRQHRQALALDWIEGLGLPAGSQALEVGPGSGFITTALAQREFIVAAADATPRMLDTMRQRADAAGVAHRVRPLAADAHHLPFDDGAFRLVVALGVVPWLRSAPLAVAEMTRVLEPGGYLVLNADNSDRLALRLDPRHNPRWAPARLYAKSLLHSKGMLRPRQEEPRITAHRLADFDRILRAAGLELLRRSTFGFGPFTMFGVPMTSARLGIRLNARLQRLADQGMPGVRSAGAQYLVLARAPLAGRFVPAGR
jgi:ubiquinone/menaquinone biosynthesis C-methylase UbiE